MGEVGSSGAAGAMARAPACTTAPAAAETPSSISFRGSSAGARRRRVRPCGDDCASLPPRHLQSLNMAGLQMGLGASVDKFKKVGAALAVAAAQSRLTTELPFTASSAHLLGQVGGERHGGCW